jgi:acetyl-CoA carboxylase biotin carboxyl carrier protein
MSDQEETNQANREDEKGRKKRQKSAARSIDLEELRELLELVAEYDLTDFELEKEDLRVHLRRGYSVEGPSYAVPAPGPPPAAPQARQVAEPQPAQTAAPVKAETDDLYTITAPIVGTFYRSSSPTAEPFVKVGSRVGSDTVVCIIEAMKLMNEIQAEVSGEVVKIFVENGQPVEYGQALFGIKRK